MCEPVDFVILLMLGLAGWRVAYRLGVPSAAILGPMLCVAAGACLGLPRPDFPEWYKVSMQVVVGVFAGTRVDRTTVADVKRLGRTAALVTGWIVASALAIGYLVGLLPQIELCTSLLGCSPGGLMEMSAMAISVRADVPTVALLQTCRLAATMVVVPVLARRLPATQHGCCDQRPASMPGGSPPTGAGSEAEMAVVSPDAGVSLTADHPAGWVISLGVGAAGALLLRSFRIPAGGVVGSLLFVAMARTLSGRVGRPPVALRTAAQIGMGVLVGTLFDRETPVLLLSLLPAAITATVATVGSALALARFTQRELNSDARTAVLACAPAGATQMIVVADELGADVAHVSLFQLTRTVCAIVVLPLVFRLLL